MEKNTTVFLVNVSLSSIKMICYNKPYGKILGLWEWCNAPVYG